jgi:hypothetical protein
MKMMTPEEQAKWSLTFMAVTLEYIHTGPPPPDKERDSRLTDDKQLQQLITQRYRESFGQEALDMTRVDVEGVTLHYSTI